MSEERLEIIKENVYMRSEIAKNSRLGIDTSLGEELELLKEIDRLNNIINTILEFSFFKEECPLNFGFGDKKEAESQDIFYSDEYCENNCNDEHKKCWLKYFERLKELKDSD